MPGRTHPPDAPEPGPIETALRREGSQRRFARGDVLFVEGDRSDRVFVIEHGWVLVYCTAANGRDVVLAVRGPGDVLGDLSVLEDRPRSASALALEPIEAVMAPRSAMRRALDDVAVAHELIRVLGNRLREAERRRVEFATQSTLGRVAGRLLELAERFGREGPEGLVVELPLSQDQLASWCSASREATVKALGSLRTLGAIATSRRRMVVLDLDALRRHATAIG